MRRQTYSRPHSGYRGREIHGDSGSSDGFAPSSSSSGSDGQPSPNRPVVRPGSNPLSLPAAAAESVNEVVSFTMNGQRISETYKRRPSVHVSPSKSHSPASPAVRNKMIRQGVGFQQTPHRPLTLNTRGNWAAEQELKLKILSVPKICWTKDVYFAMSRFGNVTKIDIEVGNQDNNAWVVFQPPPDNLPSHIRINGKLYRYEVRTPSLFMVTSPVSPAKQYHEVNIFRADSLSFGVQNGEKSFLSMYEVSTNGKVQIALNLKRTELEIQFPLKIDDDSHNFSFHLPISQLSRIHHTVDGVTSSSLIIPFNRPPRFFVHKKPTVEDDSLFPTNERIWTVWNTMFRETDVVTGNRRRAMQTTSLIDHKGSAIIDIGRWTAYSLSFKNDTVSGPKFEEFRAALSDFGVTVEDCDYFSIASEKPPQLNEMLEEEFSDPYSHLKSSQRTSSAYNDLAFDRIHLPFSVRYQLEACLSNGFIEETSVTQEFLQRLNSMNPHQAAHVLEKVVDKQQTYYDPMHVFEIRSKVTRLRTIPKHCIMQRSVNITPTMMHVTSPIMEISNRITRQYIADADRFIRVKFTDEKGEGALRTMPGGRADALFDRVSRAFKQGIVVAGRQYEFLAFGNSQFRENGAYFYSPSSTKSAHDIRVTLGQFDHIKTVAKYGARLGQCFSTTRAMQTTVVVQKTPDIERNGYTFSDGVGKLSLFLAQMAAQDLGLQNAFDDPPSLYQFRLGGCKGVLALDPTITKNEVHIRPSQFKFEAPYTGLEIIRSSSLATPFFNRQIIIVLGNLGVPDHVFIRKQQDMVNAYELAMADKTEALKCLLKHIDVNQMTLTMASMVLDGFLESREPFMMSLLHLWRASTIKELKKKARIAIDDGAFVLGCIDESGLLQGHRNEPQSRLDATREEKLETLPEIFLQIDDTTRKGHFRVIEGICVLARNPSLHPGDIRVVRAVNVPVLRHHKNAVVLPQTGDRDLANMCSGGDLDGDDYMVLWDKDLIPSVINVPPMDYTPEKPIDKADPVNISDVCDFFVTYMKNDSLGQIAHAHLAQADQQPKGVGSHACIELAKLHSQAVDYPKSGIPAIMDPALRPKKWPHFMEKKHKLPSRIYRSKNILGMLYDQVQLVDFKPIWESSFDQRILDRFDIEESLLKNAAEVKAEYDDDLKRLMAKHGIQTEFEAFSTFVLSHNQETRDYKFAEEFGRTVGVLKAQYREVCLKASGATSVADWETLGPFVAAMYSVTAMEVRSALKECDQTRIVGGQMEPLRKMKAEHMPFMSFPWLFHTQLGKLATGSETGTVHPIQAQRPSTHRATKSEGLEGLGRVETDRGITRFGEMLNLDFGDIQRNDHQLAVGDEEHGGTEGKRGSHTGSSPAAPSHLPEHRKLCMRSGS